jgi:hypothetical protein
MLSNSGAMPESCRVYFEQVLTYDSETWTLNKEEQEQNQAIDLKLRSDGFLDFFHRPKNKILQLKLRCFGRWFCFRPQVRRGGKGGTLTLLGPLYRASLDHWTTRVSQLQFHKHPTLGYVCEG